MTLFWRVVIGDVVIVLAFLALLTYSPATVSYPPSTREIIVLVVGTAALLLANAWVVNLALRPLAHLRDAMEVTESSLAPALVDVARIDVGRDDEVNRVAQAYNSMLERLQEERARSSGRALQAQEEERVRISRELHDEVGQSLTALLLSLAQAAQECPPEALLPIERAQDLARKVLDDVREISASLRPSVLNDLGIVPALNSLISEFTGLGGLTLRKEIHHIGPASPEQELTLYRVAQEALTNVHRHAQASTATISLRRVGDTAVLAVEDDGIGVTALPGTGRTGMHERALLVGGTLDVVRRPEGGTCVCLQVPLTVSATDQEDG